MKRSAALALLLFVAACGSENNNNGIATVGGTPTAGPTAAALSQQEQGLKYVACMREQGIEMPDPDPQTGRIMMRFGPGTDRAKVQAAQEACKALAPAGMGGQGQGDPQMAENMRKFAQCMRDNGVESFPDPEGGAMRLDPASAQDPDFQAARAKCSAQHLPQAGGGS